ncbi:MAG TPA: hypothetical protein VHZ54_10505 [Solirubrobacterales bacterium]|jgi:hypothetical protein|nr:hypothetical protein [Solirubrobacterales bacterium]
MSGRRRTYLRVPRSGRRAGRPRPTLARRGLRRLLSAGALAGLLSASLLLSAPCGAEVVQRGGIRVGFEGSLSPKRLPRSGTAPVKVALGARIAGVEGAPAPRLRRIEIAINRYGVIDRDGLALCTMEQVQPTTDADAMRACGSSLVGRGRFSAQVGFSGQTPFPAAGRLLAFNGTYHGHPAILAHVYGTRPVPTSYTFAFMIESTSGTYGTVLRATVPGATGSAAYITGLSLDLERSYTAEGSRHSFLSAGCPAPKGFGGATFPFARATFGFAGGATLSDIAERSCRARG